MPQPKGATPWNKGLKLPSPSPETRAKMSAALMGNQRTKGHKASPETLAKLSAAHKGHQSTLGHRHTEETKAKMSEAHKGPRTGDVISYRGVHHRASKVLPMCCAHCGTTKGRLECALNHPAAPPENIRREPGVGRAERVFSVKIEDYIRLCKRCHVRFDRKA